MMPPMFLEVGGDEVSSKPASSNRSAALKFGTVALALTLGALVVYSSGGMLGHPAAGPAPTVRRLKTTFHMDFELNQAKAKQEQHVNQVVKVAMHHINAAQKKSKEAEAHGVETEVDYSLIKSNKRLAQWRLRSAEVVLETAAHDAKYEYEDCEDDAKDGKLPEWSPAAKHHYFAARKAVEAFIHWGAFEDAHGQSNAEAIESLESAVELAALMAKNGKPADLSLLAQAQLTLGRVQCHADSSKGYGFVQAQKLFQQALQTVTSAQIASKDGLKGSPVEAEVRLDYAECLYNEADVPAAHSQADKALTALRAVGTTDPSKKRLSERLVRVRAMVFHDQGAVENAARLYSEYLEAIGATAGAQRDPDITAEYFHIMQNSIVKMEGDGKIEAALVKLADLERLQVSADKLMHEKNDGQYLMPQGVLDLNLWSAMARTMTIKSHLLLAQSGSKNMMLAKGAQDVIDITKAMQDLSETNKKQLRKQALKLAQKAVDMLEQDGERRDLIDAVTTVGFVQMEMKNHKKAVAFMKEALAISEEEHLPDSIYIATGAYHVGFALEESGKPKAALEHYQRAYEIEVKALGNKDPEVAGLLGIIADILERIGTVDEAKKAANKAVITARLAYPQGGAFLTAAEERFVRLGGDHHA